MNNETLPLAGKVSLVTGAARGIGRGIALALAEKGSAVVIVDIDGAQAQETAGWLAGQGYQACAAQADVRLTAQIEAALKTAVDRFGKVDVLVNNAGVLKMGDALEIPEADWDLVMDVNVKGTFLCCQVFGRYFAEQGRGGAIVNISSVAGKKGFEQQMHYSASKAAVINMTKVLASELAPFRVRVNAVCPGIVDTELFDQCLNWSADYYHRPADELLSDWMRPVLIHRRIQPVEIGRIVAFLAGDEACIITGQSINADGGAAPC